MRNRKKLNTILAVMLFGVWGTVGYNVLAELNSGEDEVPGAEPFPGSNMTVEVTYRYEANVRDPFRYYVPRDSAKKSDVARSDSAQWFPPPFRLCAITGNGECRSAILEDTQGEVHVLRAGDTLGGLKVVQVSAALVRYRYSGREAHWQMGQIWPP